MRRYPGEDTAIQMGEFHEVILVPHMSFSEYPRGTGIPLKVFSAVRNFDTIRKARSLSLNS